jgi:hypothetical protein
MQVTKEQEIAITHSRSDGTIMDISNILEYIYTLLRRFL